MAEDKGTFFFLIDPLKQASDFAFKKGQEFATFLFPTPEYIMTPRAEESSRRHADVIGEDITETIKNDVIKLKGETLSLYKEAFTTSGLQFSGVVLVGVAVFLFLVLKK